MPYRATPIRQRLTSPTHAVTTSRVVPYRQRQTCPGRADMPVHTAPLRHAGPHRLVNDIPRLASPSATDRAGSIRHRQTGLTQSVPSGQTTRPGLSVSDGPCPTCPSRRSGPGPPVRTNRPRPHRQRQTPPHQSRSTCLTVPGPPVSDIPCLASPSVTYPTEPHQPVRTIRAKPSRPRRSAPGHSVGDIPSRTVRDEPVPTDPCRRTGPIRTRPSETLQAGPFRR
jgi:hypothetical protein